MDNKYHYNYERTADYCYKGTDILINKLNITNEEERGKYINIYCDDEIIYKYTPKDNEKIVRFVAVSNTNSFPISKENIKDKYGIVSYKIERN